MIKNFKDKDTQALWERKVVPKWKQIEKPARSKLRILNATSNLYLLKQSLGKNLKPLKAGRKGQQAIKINDQYRICFFWGDDNHAYEVEIIDYHDE